MNDSGDTKIVSDFTIDIEEIHPSFLFGVNSILELLLQWGQWFPLRYYY
jgi:hypothetical protein